MPIHFPFVLHLCPQLRAVYPARLPNSVKPAGPWAPSAVVEPQAEGLQLSVPFCAVHYTQVDCTLSVTQLHELRGIQGSIACLVGGSTQSQWPERHTGKFSGDAGQVLTNAQLQQLPRPQHLTPIVSVVPHVWVAPLQSAHHDCGCGRRQSALMGGLWLQGQLTTQSGSGMRPATSSSWCCR
jgi:hypothetical protein